MPTDTMAGTVAIDLAAPRDDLVHAYRAWRRSGEREMPWQLREALAEIGCHNAMSGTYQSPPSPWVASLSLRPDGGLLRDFLDGHRDYTDATDDLGSQGVRVTFHLRPGYVYEIGEVVEGGGYGRRWKPRLTYRRYFAAVADGAVVELARDEALRRV